MIPFIPGATATPQLQLQQSTAAPANLAASREDVAPSASEAGAGVATRLLRLIMEGLYFAFLYIVVLDVCL